MKKLLLFSFVLIQYFAHAQYAAIDRCIGGNQNDSVKEVIATDDGGLLIISQTFSNDRDFPDNHGSQDIGLIKLDANRNVQWKKCIGTSDFDIYEKVVEYNNRYYILTYNTSYYASWATTNLWIIDNSGNLIRSSEDQPNFYSDYENLNISVDSLSGVYVSFSSYDNLYIHKYDFNGDSLWANKFSFENYLVGGWGVLNYNTFSLMPINNELIAEAMITHTGFGLGDIIFRPVFIKIDSNGNEVARNDSAFQNYLVFFDHPYAMCLFKQEGDSLILPVDYKGVIKMSIDNLGITADPLTQYSTGPSPMSYASPKLIKESNLGKLFEDGYYLNSYRDSATHSILSIYNYRTSERHSIPLSDQYFVSPVIYFQEEDSSFIYTLENGLYDSIINVLKFKMDGTMVYSKRLWRNSNLIMAASIGPQYMIKNKKWYKITTGSEAYTPYMQFLWAFDIDSGSLSYLYASPYNDSVTYSYIEPLNADTALFTISDFPGDRSCRYGGRDIGLGKLLLNANQIAGAAYVDYNSNNIYDSGDQLYNLAFLESSKQQRTISNYMLGSLFTINKVDSGIWSTKIILPNNYFDVAPPVNVTSHADLNHKDTAIFIMHPRGTIHDLTVNLVNTFITRLGRATDYEITYSNNGTHTETGDVKLLLDQRLTVTNTSPAFTTSSNDTLIWHFTNLKTSEYRKIVISVMAAIPPDLNIGDMAMSAAMIGNEYTDSMPADNQSILQDRVRGAYDPNDKVSTNGDDMTTTQIQNGDYITYVVRFQNTGNDTAFKVVILDTLSSNVDWNTFQMVNASHNFSVQILNQHILQFSSNNIKLPPTSINEDASHGFVAYKVKPKSTLTPGDTIKNTAHIYFDYNAPVNTSTVNTRITLLTRVADLPKNNLLKIYPNPNNGIFNIEFAGDTPLQSISIFDLSGRKVLEEKISSGKIIPVNMENFASGIYTIELKTATDRYIQKILLTE